MIFIFERIKKGSLFMTVSVRKWKCRFQRIFVMLPECLSWSVSRSTDVQEIFWTLVPEREHIRLNFKIVVFNVLHWKFLQKLVKSSLPKELKMWFVKIFLNSKESSLIHCSY